MIRQLYIDHNYITLLVTLLCMFSTNVSLQWRPVAAAIFGYCTLQLPSSAVIWCLESVTALFLILAHWVGSGTLPWCLPFTDYSNNSTDTWQTLNSFNLCKNTSKDVILNHNGSTVSEASGIAEVFKKYFSNVAFNLNSNIRHSNISPLNFLGAPVENSFFCSTSDWEEIVNLIRMN